MATKYKNKIKDASQVSRTSAAKVQSNTKTWPIFMPEKKRTKESGKPVKAGREMERFSKP
jgi:hypothetical protein